jgi:exodeoxyribonuclease-3
MRLATWNVNSLKARLGRVEEWLGLTEPDVLCVQETKLADDAFPALSLATLGYDAVHHGQGRWNGVAILSRIGIEDVVHGFAVGPPDPDARLLTARCGSTLVVTAYAPNGRAVGHEQFFYKLDWFDRLLAHIDALADPEEPVIVCGDLNIAPDDSDVARPDEWRGTVLCHDDVRASFRELIGWGLVDCFRKHHPNGGVYSWWDYRMLAFPKGNGLRIDHVLATPQIAERCHAATIDREQRKGKLPSDHAPVIVELAR